MFDVIMPFHIYLPNLPNISTLCNAVDRERLSVFRAGHGAQKSGHLLCRPSFRSAVSAAYYRHGESNNGPGVDSASNRNEYQENFLGVNAAGA